MAGLFSKKKKASGSYYRGRAERSNDHAPSYDLRQTAENGGNYVERGDEDVVAITCDDAEQPAITANAPAPLQLFDVVKPVVSACVDPGTTVPDPQAEEEEEAAGGGTQVQARQIRAAADCQQRAGARARAGENG